MNTIYIYHHLGLGDHIQCNAIVRIYAEKYDKLYLFAKPKYSKNVQYLYRDDPKIKIIAMDDNDVKNFISFNKNNNYLIVGHTKEYFDGVNSGKFTFDEGFYKMLNIPFEDKWNKFYFKRDLDVEKNTYYNKLGLKDNEEYLFVHDDKERGRHFKPQYIEKGLKIIRATDHKDIGIFDLIYTIEKAKEVHVMNSSFSCLIDTMQIYNDNLYYHEYARTDMGNNPNHKFKMNWIILKS